MRVLIDTTYVRRAPFSGTAIYIELVAEYRRRALVRAREYSWDAVIDQYAQLLTAVSEARGPGRLPAPALDRRATYASSSIP